MKFGCSSFLGETKDGRNLLGRSYDQFGNLRANRVIRVPQGAPCAPGLQENGGEVPGKYAYTGMAVLGFGEPILVDGVNQVGLAKADPNYEVYEQTLCTSVMCAESGVYYFAPAQNRRISAVRLSTENQELRYFDLGDKQDVDYRN